MAKYATDIRIIALRITSIGDYLQDAIADALQAERERCARIAESRQDFCADPECKDAFTDVIERIRGGGSL